MNLTLWSHPKTGHVRLYASAKFLKRFPGLDYRETKIWIESSRKSKSGWVVKAKGDTSPIADNEEEAKSLFVMNLGIDAGASWDDIVAMAKAAPKPQDHRPMAREKDGAANGEALSRVAEAEGLQVSSIKMTAAITIYLDHREPPALGELLDAHELVTVERTALALGDIMVEDRDGHQLLIERKRCDDVGTKTDFEASIQTDGRLFDQSERLKLAASAGDRQVIPIFLLEGDVYRNASSMSCQQIDGAISFLSAVQRVSVLPTLSLNHTAYVIAKLASHFVDGLYTPVALHKAKPKVLFEQQRYVLEALPGVSSKIAEVLLQQFGSIRGVMSASEADLLATPGLGKKKVAELMQVLGG